MPCRKWPVDQRIVVESCRGGVFFFGTLVVKVVSRRRRVMGSSSPPWFGSTSTEKSMPLVAAVVVAASPAHDAIGIHQGISNGSAMDGRLVEFGSGRGSLQVWFFACNQPWLVAGPLCRLPLILRKDVL